MSAAIVGSCLIQSSHTHSVFCTDNCSVFILYIITYIVLSPLPCSAVLCAGFIVHTYEISPYKLWKCITCGTLYCMYLVGFRCYGSEELRVCLIFFFFSKPWYSEIVIYFQLISINVLIACANHGIQK